MQDDDGLFVLIAFFVGGFIGALSCGMWRDSEAKQTAINHGAAVWAIDPKTGATEFKWLKCERETTTARGE